jgi:hypothetical protein
LNFTGKTNMKRYLLSFIVGSLALAAYAATHRSMSVINGTNAKFYIGTADTATTFAQDDAYNTNRTYVNGAGTTITPLSTNSVSSAINTTFIIDIDAWADSNGNVPPGAITVAATAAAAFTNTATFTFVRSVNGTDYDTTNPFQFVFTPSGTALTVLTTNIPASFLNGSRRIRWQNVITGANPTDNGNLTVNRIAVGGFVP